MKCRENWIIQSHVELLRTFACESNTFCILNISIGHPPRRVCASSLRGARATFLNEAGHALWTSEFAHRAICFTFWSLLYFFVFLYHPFFSVPQHVYRIIFIEHTCVHRSDNSTLFSHFPLLRRSKIILLSTGRDATFSEDCKTWTRDV